jgi:transcriptional regulator with XRE-family HTH domain
MSEQNHQSIERAPRGPNEALKAIRRAMGIKQSDFAAIVHFSPSQIASVESGRRTASPEFSWQIAVITGASASSIEQGAHKPLDWRGQPYSAKSYEDFQQRPGIEMSEDTLGQLLSPLKTVLQAAASAGCLKECTLKIKKEFESLVAILPGLQAAVNQKLRPVFGTKTQLTVADMKRYPELAEKLGVAKDADLLVRNGDDFVIFDMKAPSQQELWCSHWYREGKEDSVSWDSFAHRESSRL